MHQSSKPRLLVCSREGTSCFDNDCMSATCTECIAVLVAGCVCLLPCVRHHQDLFVRLRFGADTKSYCSMTSACKRTLLKSCLIIAMMWFRAMQSVTYLQGGASRRSARLRGEKTSQQQSNKPDSKPPPPSKSYALLSYVVYGNCISSHASCDEDLATSAPHPVLLCELGDCCIGRDFVKTAVVPDLVKMLLTCINPLCGPTCIKHELFAWAIALNDNNDLWDCLLQACVC